MLIERITPAKALSNVLDQATVAASVQQEAVSKDSMREHSCGR